MPYWDVGRNTTKEQYDRGVTGDSQQQQSANDNREITQETVKQQPYDFSKRQPGVLGWGVVPTAINIAKKIAAYKKDKEIRARLGLDPVDEIEMDMPNTPFGKSRVNEMETDNSNDNIIPEYAMMGGADMESEDVEPYNQFTYDENAFGPGGQSKDVRLGTYNFNQGGRARRAEGGIMELRARRAFGGIMDRVTGRKAYGLGSIFKSVKNAASKVLSSPIGKAAVLYAGGAMLGSYGSGQGFFNKGMFNPGNMGRGLFGANNTMKGMGDKAAVKGLFGKLGLTQGYGGKMPTLLGAGVLGIGGAALMGPGKQDSLEGFSNRGGSLIDPITKQEALPSEMRASLENALNTAGGDPQKIAAIKAAYPFYGIDERLGSYVPYRNYSVANGGRIGKAEGGLMDLGGMEKDYRAEGGFVPIGAKEKADDVPARLSVNEFVFTADAVRGAGQGDIDKGAEIMENMMKNLEKGGTISEESQGNIGAQQMFETSERLGEVI